MLLLLLLDLDLDLALAASDAALEAAERVAGAQRWLEVHQDPNSFARFSVSTITSNTSDPFCVSVTVRVSSFREAL